MSRYRRSSVMIVLAVVMAASSTQGQFPFGGPPGGSGSNPMAEMMERVVFGPVEDVNPVKGYIQVNVPGRGSRIVVAGENTTITQMAEIPVSELKEGDEVRITGMPAVIVADEVRIGEGLSVTEILRALQEEGTTTPSEQPADSEEDAEEAPPAEEEETPAANADQPETPPTPPEAPQRRPGGDGGAPISVTGTVMSVEPLVIVTSGGNEISVKLPEGAKVLRRTEGDLSAAEPGETLVAVGRVDDDGYLAATRIYVGETVSMGRMTGFGRRRGPRGAPGGFGMMPMGGPPSGPPASPGGGGEE